MSNNEKSCDKKENVHKKHRLRITSKYKMNGQEPFSTHQLLEMLLFYCQNIVDTNPIAHSVLDEYGKAGFFRTGIEEFIKVKGIGEKSAILMKLSSDLALRLMTDSVGSEALNDEFRQKLYTYLLMRSLPASSVIAIFLTKTGKVISHKILAKNKNIRSDDYVKAITDTAKAEKAVRVILSHNHANNTVAPSVEDKVLTEMIRAGLEKEGIVLDAHYITTDTDCVLCSI